MAFDTIKNVKINAIACAVPSKTEKTISFYSELGKETVDKFISTVGIKERRIGKLNDGKLITSADLCYSAAEEIFRKKDIARETIDALIFVSLSPDYIQPATACVLQHRLGLSEECLAYDITMGCSGYVYGLYAAASHMQSGKLRNVLLLTGESGTNIAVEDKGQMMMFGDAGAATLLGIDEKAEDVNFMLMTYGEGFKNLVVPCGGKRNQTGSAERRIRKDGSFGNDFEAYMDGTEVLNFTIKEVPRAFSRFGHEYNINQDDVDLYVLHQANLFMLNYIVKKMHVNPTKLPISMDRYGNTSSASIPLTLCDYFMRNNSTDRKKWNVLASGFGIGLSLGIVQLVINSEDCFSIIECDERFEDGLI